VSGLEKLSTTDEQYLKVMSFRKRKKSSKDLTQDTGPKTFARDIYEILKNLTVNFREPADYMNLQSFFGVTDIPA